MKRFYLYQDLIGTTHILLAESLAKAKYMLLLKNEYVFNLTAKGWLTQHSFKKTELIVITKQLATMLRAGLPIVESLTILIDDHPLVPWRWLLYELKQQIMTGETISEAIGKHTNVFPPIYKEIIAIGELTGQLDDSFNTLALQLNEALTLQKKIKKSMRYPLFLLIVSIIVTLIMLLMVLPKFAEVYENFDAELPMLTQSMIIVSESLQHHYFLFVVLLCVSYASYHFYLKKYYHTAIAKYALQVPIFGVINSTANLAQIFQTLAITQKLGIPLLTGLNVAQKTVFNLQFKHSLLLISNAIEQGNTFNQVISQHNLYPRLCVQLIRVGEESGTLDLMLTRLADYYQQKGIELTDNLAQKIEPLMMSIMAIIIGSLVIAMYLPIFQLGSVIH